MPNPSELERERVEADLDAAEEFRQRTRLKSWGCTIGEIDPAKLPVGSDLPMRRAIAAAYEELTGEEPKFIFSGWAAELSEEERAVVEDREPHRDGR